MWVGTSIGMLVPRWCAGLRPAPERWPEASSAGAQALALIFTHIFRGLILLWFARQLAGVVAQGAALHPVVRECSAARTAGLLACIANCGFGGARTSGGASRPEIDAHRQVVESGSSTRTTQSDSLRSRPGGLRSAHRPSTEPNAVEGSATCPLSALWVKIRALACSDSETGGALRVRPDAKLVGATQLRISELRCRLRGVLAPFEPATSVQAEGLRTSVAPC